MFQRRNSSAAKTLRMHLLQGGSNDRLEFVIPVSSENNDSGLRSAVELKRAVDEPSPAAVPYRYEVAIGISDCSESNCVTVAKIRV